MKDNLTIEVTEDEQRKKDIGEIIVARSKFINNGVIRDFGEYDFYDKLAVSQLIEKKFIKRRSIGGKMIPYLPHSTAEKILNFLFNFKVSNEVLEIHSVEKMSKTSYQDKYGEWKQKDSKSYDAWALVKFTFILNDGVSITRTVVGTHRSFDNIATSEHEAKKAAVSKSWVVVARTFGIGVELEEKAEAAENHIFQNTVKNNTNYPAKENIPY